MGYIRQILLWWFTFFSATLFYHLTGFDKYKGGLDTVHDLTGLTSIYTNWRSIDIMFHVSILLPYEKQDIQKVDQLAKEAM